MNKWKDIVEIALSEITDIEDLGDIAEIVISKLREWTYAERVYKEHAVKELEELADWLQDYAVRGEEE